MEKKIEIKVTINSQFEIEANPDLNDWNKSNEESKQYYVKERVKDFLLDHIDNIIDDLLNNSKIEF